MVDTDKRNCKRFTFGKDIVTHFSSIIEPYLKDFFSESKSIFDIKIEPSHGDILYYENGDFFKKHKDAVPKCPFYPFYHYYFSHLS